MRPGLSLAGVRLSVTRPHRLGFPVLRQFSVYRHAVVITPVARWVGSLVARPIPTVRPVANDGGLPQLSAWVGSHIRRFEACSSVHSRYGLPARRTAKRTCCLEGSDGFVTSTAAPIATGWSDPVAG